MEQEKKKELKEGSKSNFYSSPPQLYNISNKFNTKIDQNAPEIKYYHPKQFPKDDFTQPINNVSVLSKENVPVQSSQNVRILTSQNIPNILQQSVSNQLNQNIRNTIPREASNSLTYSAQVPTALSNGTILPGVYVAQTKGSIHIAPLPAALGFSSYHINLQDAPGTA